MGMSMTNDAKDVAQAEDGATPTAEVKTVDETPATNAAESSGAATPATAAIEEAVSRWTFSKKIEDLRSLATPDRLAMLLLMSVTVGLIVPFLGSFGFFDPWESHYGEVARQMAARNDHLYPFWKDAHFFSKPVLLFWLTSVGYRVVGAGDVDGRLPDIVEWIGRAPMALFSIICVYIMFHCARRLWGRRAAVLSGLVLVTCPYWYFLSRQAITDMLYVAPMSAALLLLAVAFLDEDGAEEREKMRIPLWLTGAFALMLIPQLLEIGRSAAFLNRVTWLGSETGTRIGVMVLLAGVGAAGLFFLHKKGRDPYIHGAASLVALATLGKGPHALLFTGLVLFLYFLTSGEWSRLKRPALIPGIGLYLAIAMPWYIVMTLFTGLGEGRKTWFDRFVKYDLFGRVGAGVHGDRATFEYYVRYFTYGIFPWSVFAPVAVVQALLKRLPRRENRTNEDRFTHFAVLWAVALFIFFSAMTTKFHHYAFPVTVPVALLIGIWLDKALQSERRMSLGLVTAAALGTLLIGRDLIKEPWQLVDLFTYHYKSYKPSYYFPPVEVWSSAIGVLALVAVVFFVAGVLGDVTVERFRRIQRHASVSSETSAAVVAEENVAGVRFPSPKAALVMTTLFVVGAGTGVWWALGPFARSMGWGKEDKLQVGLSIGGAVVVALVLALIVGFVLSAGAKRPSLWESFLGVFVRFSLGAQVLLSPGRATGNSGAVLGLLTAGLVFSVFGAQVYLPQMSQHWSQRHLIDSYYAMRNPGEPLISFQMDWKGETFYAHNSEIQIKKKRDRLKKQIEKPGREFVLVQQDRFKTIKSALGKAYADKIHVVDRSNTKWFLVRIDE